MAGPGHSYYTRTCLAMGARLIRILFILGLLLAERLACRVLFTLRLGGQLFKVHLLHATGLGPRVHRVLLQELWRLAVPGPSITPGAARRLGTKWEFISPEAPSPRYAHDFLAVCPWWSLLVWYPPVGAAFLLLFAVSLCVSRFFWVKEGDTTREESKIGYSARIHAAGPMATGQI